MVATNTLIGTYTNHLQSDSTLHSVKLAHPSTFAGTCPDPWPLPSPQLSMHRLPGWCSRASALSANFCCLCLPPLLSCCATWWPCDTTGSCRCHSSDANRKYTLCNMERLHQGQCVRFARWCTFVVLIKHWEAVTLICWEIMQEQALFSHLKLCVLIMLFSFTIETSEPTGKQF